MWKVNYFWIFTLAFVVFNGGYSAGQITGKFWHVTDFHWDLNYTQIGGDVSQMCWDTGSTNPQVDIGQFGNYACDSPWALVISTLEFMVRKLPNPDFIIWTGDDDAHVANEYFSPQKVLDIMANLTDVIRSYFPTTPVIPVFGNHDAYPKSNFPADQGSDIYLNVADLWRSWLGEEAYVSFQKGGYFVVPHPTNNDVKIIGLNTPVYYNKNEMVTANDIDPLGQLSWLDQTLNDVAAANQKAYIVAHIPPGMFGRKVQSEGQKWFRDRFNREYLDLIIKHSKTIIGQFYGHDHTDSFKLYYDAAGIPVNVHFASPAVTPWNTTLSGIGPNNPGARIFTYEPTNSFLINYEQYYLNLSKANTFQDDNWELEYDFLSAYNIPDLSYSSIDKAAQTFATADRTYFDKYYLYNSVSFSPASECDAVCQRNHYCSIVHVDYNDFVQCNSPSSNKNQASADRQEDINTYDDQFFANLWMQHRDYVRYLLQSHRHRARPNSAYEQF